MKQNLSIGSSAYRSEEKTPVSKISKTSKSKSKVPPQSSGNNSSDLMSNVMVDLHSEMEAKEQRGYKMKMSDTS
jgi:hypothetical protein